MRKLAYRVAGLASSELRPRSLMAWCAWSASHLPARERRRRSTRFSQCPKPSVPRAVRRPLRATPSSSPQSFLYSRDVRLARTVGQRIRFPVPRPAERGYAWESDQDGLIRPGVIAYRAHCSRQKRRNFGLVNGDALTPCWISLRVAAEHLSRRSAKPAAISISRRCASTIIPSP